MLEFEKKNWCQKQQQQAQNFIEYVYGMEYVSKRCFWQQTSV